MDCTFAQLRPIYRSIMTSIVGQRSHRRQWAVHPQMSFKEHYFYSLWKAVVWQCQEGRREGNSEGMTEDRRLMFHHPVARLTPFILSPAGDDYPMVPEAGWAGLQMCQRWESKMYQCHFPLLCYLWDLCPNLRCFPLQVSWWRWHRGMGGSHGQSSF